MSPLLLGPCGRAYGASSFEEERQLIIENGRFLAQFDWDLSPKVGPKTLELAVEFPVQFAEASWEVRADREAALAAVSVEGDLLMQCSETLRNDVEVVLAAVAREGRAWKYASPSLRSDRSTVLEAVRRSRYALQYASEELRSDKEVVLAAVEGDSLALVWADEAFKADRDVLVKALQKQAQEPRRIFNVLKYASPELKRDKGLVLLAVRGAATEVAARFDYEQASSDLRRSLPWEVFEDAAKSLIAVAGEDAPVLQIALTEEAILSRTGSNSSSSSSTNSSSSNSSPNFTCSVTLLSGFSFTCQVTPETAAVGARPPLGSSVLAWYWPYLGSWLGRQSGPTFQHVQHVPEVTVNDLAKMLIDELPRYAQVPKPRRVFMVLTQDDGVVVPLTPWDWKLPLADLLKSAQ